MTVELISTQESQPRANTAVVPIRQEPGCYSGAVELFLSTASPATHRAYLQDLKSLAAFGRAESPEEAAASLLALGAVAGNSVIASWRAEMIAHHLAPKTINRRLGTIRAMLARAEGLGFPSFRVLVGNLPDAPRRDTSGPTIEEIRRVLELLEGQESARAIRDRAIIRLLLDLALRRSEVASLELSDLDLEGSTIRVRGKGRFSKESLDLAPVTAAAIQDWLVVRGAKPGPLFTNFDRSGKAGGLSSTSVYRIVRDRGYEAGVVLKPHGLRHAAITAVMKVCAAQGRDVSEAMAFSRHRDIRTLLIYRDPEGNPQGELSQVVSNLAVPTNRKERS